MRGSPSFDRPKTLIMINHGRRAVSCPKPAFLWHLTPSPRLAHGVGDERFPRHLWHLPRDYSLAIRWLRPSFLTRDHWTPGRKGRDIHGLATLRYLDQGEAAVHAARSRKRTRVCLRADGLRFCAYRQRPRGDRIRCAVPAAPPSLWRESRHL